MLAFDSLINVQRARTLPDYVAREWVPQASLRDVEPIEVNGIAGATGWTQTPASPAS